MTAPALPEAIQAALTEAFHQNVIYGNAMHGGVLPDSDVHSARIAAELALRAAIAAHVAPPVEGPTVNPMWVRFDPPVRLDAPDGGIVKGHVSILPPPVSASFEEALASLDVENDYAPDRGTTYAITGLDDVRAAHAEAVEQAVIDEQDACVRVLRAFLEQCEPGDDVRLTLEQAEQNIRARGAKS